MSATHATSAGGATSTKCYIGIDLGSTTTKAVVMDADGQILGRGITNSRSNYDTACAVARQEALTQTRFTMFRRALCESGDQQQVETFLSDLDRAFRYVHYLAQLEDLAATCMKNTRSLRFHGGQKDLVAATQEVFDYLRAQAPALFRPGAARKSDFFRDLAGSVYLAQAEEVGKRRGVAFDWLAQIYDKAIIEVENRVIGGEIRQVFVDALANLDKIGGTVKAQNFAKAIEEALDEELIDDYVVGTGYGRVRLPFPKEHIRSEILCHGLGAHLMYPKTRTVLDIGGQDTKAIQVDGDGIVTSFQMNDRCAAGCGRYLGYIADEMNIGLHELGPLAMQSGRPARINSTCTVFAGAELRDRLALGEKREDILAGLHRAIILRAMSILSRSGGVSSEFTFTGGVAKNDAAVRELRRLIAENYGDVPLNINPDSIYTGALGAAEFARRARVESSNASQEV